METLLLFAMVLGLLLLGAPISVSLGLSSVLFLQWFSNDSLSSMAQKLFEAMQHYTLLAIPFFILSSSFMSTGGVAKRIIRFAIAVVGPFLVVLQWRVSLPVCSLLPFPVRRQRPWLPSVPS